jgi:hypothetical protein
MRREYTCAEVACAGRRNAYAGSMHAPGVCMRRRRHAGRQVCAGVCMRRGNTCAGICMRRAPGIMRQYASPGSMYAPGVINAPAPSIRLDAPGAEDVSCAGSMQRCMRSGNCMRGRQVSHAPGSEDACMRQAPGMHAPGYAWRGSMHAPEYACAGELIS